MDAFSDRTSHESYYEDTSENQQILPAHSQQWKKLVLYPF